MFKLESPTKDAVREIPLTRGKVALVDDEDYEELARYKWHAHRRYNGWRAARTVPGGVILMHREIMGFVESTSLIDHRNGDGLDNRRSNLRVATAAQNGMNRGKQRNNQSGFKGVRRRTNCTARWEAHITIARKMHSLGHFSSPEEAARAYDAKAREVHREFARVNFPE
jgi:hypothetical protein